MGVSLTCVYIGGALHLAWAAFHLFASRAFDWRNALANLDDANRAFYQLLNLCLVFYLLGGAYFCLAYGPELLTEGLGRKLLIFFAAFWLMRLGLQNRFFKVISPVSMALSLGYLLTLAVYVVPILRVGR